MLYTQQFSSILLMKEVMDNVNTSLNVVLEMKVSTQYNSYTLHTCSTHVTRKCVESTVENIAQYTTLCTQHTQSIFWHEAAAEHIRESLNGALYNNTLSANKF